MFPTKRSLSAGFALCLFPALSAAPCAAQNQVIKQPDFLQTLGVGARSVAMGEAYSAIGNDASAAFWNPGRLGFLQYSELQLDYRTVLNSSATFTQDINGTVRENPAGLSSGKLQSGFFGATYRLSKRESIAISNTLGGYYDNVTTTNTGNDFNVPGSLPTSTSVQRTTVRNNFLTLAYGNKITLGREVDTVDRDGKILRARRPAGFLSVGFSGFGVNQGFRRVSSSSGVGALPTAIDDERGLGYGASVGLAYDTPRAKNNSGMHVGLSYRTKVSLSGLNPDVGQAFNTEIPERLTFGVAHDQQFANGASLWISAEFQYLGAANRGGAVTQQDERKAVGDFHFGAEYTPFTSADYRLPLRFGFRTNSAAATFYTSYDNVISLGFAYQGLHNGKITYSIEPTAEILGSTGLTQVTVTGRVLF